MTIGEASERFGIAPQKLKYYEEQGLFDCHKNADGTIDYCEELLDYVGIINILMEAGAAPDTLRDFMQRLMRSGISKEEKLLFLRRQRDNLLEAIHTKQKSLDQLDFVIHEATKI